jgi:hypothetical protein
MEVWSPSWWWPSSWQVQARSSSCVPVLRQQALSLFSPGQGLEASWM